MNKFRVWNGSKMEYNVMAGALGTFYVPGIDPADAACMSPFNTIYSDQTLAMRFTGLYDKTGREIFEADILKNDDGKVFEVFWDRGGAQFELRNGNHFEPLFTHAEDFKTEEEIIGNVFENKELLA